MTQLPTPLSPHCPQFWAQRELHLLFPPCIATFWIIPYWFQPISITCTAFLLFFSIFSTMVPFPELSVQDAKWTVRADVWGCVALG